MAALIVAVFVLVLLFGGGQWVSTWLVSGLPRSIGTLLLVASVFLAACRLIWTSARIAERLL